MDQLNNKPDISSLPPKVMEKIFDFLTFRERKRASLTCKTWYQAAFSPKFCRNLCLCIEVCMSSFEDIRSYQNYRNARFATEFTDQNQSAIAEFFRAAPLESLRICGNINSLITLLDDHLLSMNQLSTLEVCVNEFGAITERVIISINHPSLKSVRFHDQLGHANIEIHCPNLTYLSMAKGKTEGDGLKAVQLAIKLQHQLETLAVFTHGNQQLEMLTNANLSSLKILCLKTSNISNGTKLCFNGMVNLVELHMSCFRQVTTVGEELGVLKNLSTLTLIGVALDMEGFEEALHKMYNLKDLRLHQCALPTSSWQIASNNFRNLAIDWRGRDPFMLPLCRQLKSFKLTICSKTPDDIFVQICDCYPQLEKLYFNPDFGPQAAEFRSSTTFWHLKALKHLKELHIAGLRLRNVNWTICRCMEIEKLRLDYCGLYDNDVSHLFKSIGPQLRQIFLKDQLFVR